MHPYVVAVITANPLYYIYRSLIIEMVLLAVHTKYTEMALLPLISLVTGNTVHMYDGGLSTIITKDACYPTVGANLASDLYLTILMVEHYGLYITLGFLIPKGLKKLDAVNSWIKGYLSIEDSEKRVPRWMSEDAQTSQLLRFN
ncbi:hypothetical protein ACJX0J_029811, partial [Zea mays]